MSKETSKIVFVGGNCQVEMVGTEMVIRLDTAKVLKASASGKSIVVASSGGRQNLAGGCLNITFDRPAATAEEIATCEAATIAAAKRAAEDERKRLAKKGS